MKLKEWLKKNKKSVIEFSKEIGVTRQFVYLLIWEQVKPSLDLAIRIDNITNGKVGIRSWVE